METSSVFLGAFGWYISSVLNTQKLCYYSKLVKNKFTCSHFVSALQLNVQIAAPWKARGKLVAIRTRFSDQHIIIWIEVVIICRVRIPLEQVSTFLGTTSAAWLQDNNRWNLWPLRASVHLSKQQLPSAQHLRLKTKRRIASSSSVCETLQLWSRH